MRILFVVPYPPSLVRVRPYNLIKYLSERGHEITVATLWTSDEERRATERLQRLCHRVVAFHLPRWRSAWNCLRSLPTATPLQAAYSWQPALATRVVALSATTDIVHVEHLRGVKYAVTLSQNGHHVPVVWDSVDCISHLFSQASHHSRSLKGRIMTRLELEWTRRYEAWLIQQFDQVLVTSRVDRTALRKLLKGKDGRDETQASPIDVLPNGVDLEYFAPSPEEREPNTLIFSGKMSYHANISAALHLIKDIMPHVWSIRPNVRVWLVGKDPTREVQTLAQESPNVVVTGTVPDIRPYLRRATLSVAPILYGAGIQNKVLEAMACGTPVITNTCATSSLDVKHARDVCIADTATDFAESILHLLDEPVRREELGQAGRTYVAEHHNWATIAAELEGVYHRLVIPTGVTT